MVHDHYLTLTSRHPSTQRQPRLLQSHWWKTSVRMWPMVSCPGPQKSTPAPLWSETSTFGAALRPTRCSSLCFRWWQLDVRLSATAQLCSEASWPLCCHTGRHPARCCPQTPHGTSRPPASWCPAWERASSCLLCLPMSTKPSPTSLPLR